MKVLAVAGLMVVSSLAFAVPKVGDYAKMSMTVNTQHGLVSGIYEEKVTNIDGDNMDVTYTFTMPDGSTQQEVQTSSVSQWTQYGNSVQQALADCSGSGGTPVQVTVKSETLTGCQLTYDGSSGAGVYVLANVPFYFASFQLTGNHFSSATLMDYAWGK